MSDLLPGLEHVSAVMAEEAYKNGTVLAVRACVGADVGGTLTKVVFFEPKNFDEQEHGKVCRE